MPTSDGRKTCFGDYALTSPRGERDWRANHAIRRTVLFEARGDPYDEHHPDEHAPGHHPKVLTLRGEPVGVVRIDIAGTLAFFRRVAIRPDVQRRGHGRVLLALAAQFAREHGCTEAQSSVTPDAVDFYTTCGFAVRQPRSAGHSRRAAVLMGRPLEPGFVMNDCHATLFCAPTTGLRRPAADAEGSGEPRHSSPKTRGERRREA